MKRLFLMMVWFLAASLVSYAETPEDIAALKAKAESGDASAQFGLGLMYDNGYEVSKDDQEAVKWYRMAAEQGHALAQFNLGFMYGVAEDYQDAVKWFLKAAEQGDASAQLNLGLMYEFGKGVAEDDQEAVKWYRKAAEQGDARAQCNLGLMYANGEGVAEDDQEAVKWYRKSAEQGNARAQCNLGSMYANGEGVAEDDQEAAKWWRKAAEQGEAYAQCNLGLMYRNGEGVVEDYVEAYAWFVLSAMNGNSLARGKKEILGNQLSTSQIAAGQQRAKELQSQIERKKVVSDSEQPLPADIAPSGFGSGLLIKGGYVLTCWHVVEGAERISVSLNGKDYVAKVLQKDAANDVAVLRASEAEGGVSLTIADDTKLGEQVFTLGYPLPDLQGSDVKFTMGSISGLTGPENTPRYFQISAPLQSGNSGGPLFDEKGNLAGIVAAKLDSLSTLVLTGDLPQNVNYAIKIDYILPLLKTIDGLDLGKEKASDVNLLELIDEMKKSAVMIKVY